MYLNLKCIVLTILSYQCSTIFSILTPDVNEILNFNAELPAGEPCSFKFPIIDKHFMAIPYQPNITGAKIIPPGKNGYIYVGHGEYFQFSCSSFTFVSPTSCKGKTEVTVKCLKKNTVSYNGRRYNFDIFRCSKVPKAKLMITNKTCNGEKNGVFNIGFDTKVDLTLYKVCFDTKIKHTLYAWNYVNTPTLKSIQTSKLIPQFVKSEHFQDINMVQVYSSQMDTAKKFLEGTSLTSENVIVKDTGRFLIPTRLLSRNQFPYVFQQHATYFYENTAPHWSIFSRGIWKEVERAFLRNLYKNNGKRLVVSGTYNSSFLIPSKTLSQKPFALHWPDVVPVPLYLWKMDYDVSKKKGIVYIGYNKPLNKGDTVNRFCKEIPCPNKFARNIADIDLIFCCSKESFEKVYGQIDPVVFEEF